MIMVNFKQLMFDKSLNQSDLAQIWGVSQSLVSKVIRGERGVPEYYIAKLVEHFGDDVINQYTIPDKPFEGITKDVQVTIIDPETVQEMRKEVEEELIEVESIPILPGDVATKHEVNIREYIEESGGELERINPSQMLRHADLAERILHTSMLPTFQPEDTVFIRFIQDRMKIVDGNTYYIDSRNYPTLIRRVKLEGEDKIRLIAQNRQFGDIVIDRADILNIGAIVGLLRMNFGNQYDELEALRVKKDEHLDRMMEMLERREEQQSKLIDYITRDK